MWFRAKCSDEKWGEPTKRQHCKCCVLYYATPLMHARVYVCMCVYYAMWMLTSQWTLTYIRFWWVERWAANGSRDIMVCVRIEFENNNTTRKRSRLESIRKRMRAYDNFCLAFQSRKHTLTWAALKIVTSDRCETSFYSHTIEATTPLTNNSSNNFG